MASIPSNSWQIEGEKVDAMTDFIFLVSQITADGDCSHEIKRCLLLVRKAMTNLDSILKSKDHFADKGSYSQSYGFSSSVQLLSCVRLFVTPWTAAQQASLSIINSRSLLKLMSIELMPSNHLILYHPLLLPPFFQ